MSNISRTLLILIATVSCSHCMEEQFDIIENWRNSYGVNDSNSTNKILDFYSNKDAISKYLKEKIININDNGSIQFKTDNINKFDWDLFTYNIKHSASARANLQILLKEFSKSRKISNLEVFENIFYEYFNTDKHHNYTINRIHELIGIILYYYLDSIGKGDVNQVENIQRKLGNTILQEKQFINIFKEYHIANYCNLYLLKLDKEHYKYKILKGENTDELTRAIEIIQEIDLADILKHIIISINIGETLFIGETLNTTEEIKEPLFITNGNYQCWFRSTLQLINSAIELCPNDTKNQLKSKKEYILVKFLKYLKDDSIKVFNNDYTTKIRILPKITSFNTLFSEFKERLPDNVKQARNTEDINKAEKILYYLNKNGIISNITIALPILAKLFPEIEYLFPQEKLNKGWEILNKNIDKIINNYPTAQTIFKSKNSIQTKYYFPYCICDDTSKMDFKQIPNEYYNNPYFITLDDNEYAQTSLKNQIYTHQYRIGLDNNYNLIIYTLKGMQLSNPFGTGTKHSWAHIALKNTLCDWYFADSLNPYSNPNWSITMFDIDNSKLNDIPPIADAFMYRKINTNEIVNYINRA